MLKGSKSETRTRKTKNIPAVCPICGKPFMRSQIDVEAAQCIACSRKCGYVLRSQRTVPRNYDAESQMKHCARCDRWLPVDDFALAQGNRSGPHKRQAYCHWCGAEKSYEWKTLNREAKKRHARKSYWKNREKNIARCRVENMTEEQRLTKNARQRVYRKAHPELILMLNRTRRLTEAAAGGQIDRRTVERLLALQQNRCAVCGIELTNVAFHVDHRTPLSRGGTNEFSNLQILCKSCNLRKSGRDPIEFMNSEGYLI